MKNSSRTRTDAQLLRVTFEHRRQMSLQDAVWQFNGLTSVMYLSYLLSFEELVPLDFEHAVPTRQVSDMRLLGNRALTRTTVEHISYNSPLEIVLGVSSAAGSALSVGYAAVRLFERIQNARVTKAESDVRVEAAQVVIQALREKYADKEIESLDLDWHIDAAASIALEMQSVKVLTNDES